MPNLTELWFYLGRHQIDTDPRKLYPMPQLPSIKSLYMEIYDLTTEQFCLCIGGLFPNLTELTVKIDPEFVSERDRFRAKVQEEFTHLESLVIVDQDCLTV